MQASGDGSLGDIDDDDAQRQNLLGQDAEHHQAPNVM